MFFFSLTLILLADTGVALSSRESTMGIPPLIVAEDMEPTIVGPTLAITSAEVIDDVIEEEERTPATTRFLDATGIDSEIQQGTTNRKNAIIAVPIRPGPRKSDAWIPVVGICPRNSGLTKTSRPHSSSWKEGKIPKKARR